MSLKSTIEATRYKMTNSLTNDSLEPVIMMTTLLMMAHSAEG